MSILSTEQQIYSEDIERWAAHTKGGGGGILSVEQHNTMRMLSIEQHIYNEQVYVLLNAEFVLPASDGNNTIANVSTFLGNLGQLLRCPTSDKPTIIKISAQDHGIHFNDNIIVIDNKPVTVMVSCDLSVNVTISTEVQENLKDETAWLYLNTECRFGIKIRFYKKHLDMITQSD